MKKYILLLIILFSLALIFNSCDIFKSNEPIDNSGLPSKEFSTDQGGNLKDNKGAEIIVPTGAVSKDGDGNNGKVIVTIENNIAPTDYPLSIPDNFILIGNVHHFGPSHYTFQYPIHVILPASSLPNLEGVYIIWYNELDTKWVSIPISEIDEANKRLGVSVFELGYFAIVQDKQVIGGFVPGSEIQEYHRSGGARMQHPGNNECFYTFIVTGFVPIYPEDAVYSYSNFTASTGSKLGGNGPRASTYMMGLRPGSYSIVVARQKAGSLFNPPGPTEYYSVPAQITVNSFENLISWDMQTNNPWSEIVLSGGEWLLDFPVVWPAASVSLGTGQLQLTLSWTNTSSRIYTIDLFCYGPNNQNVSWHSPLSEDGSFALDKTSSNNQIGYNVRNIYSKKTMPTGDYKLYVNIWFKHTGDSPMPFEIRVIRNGKFTKLLRSTISVLNKEEEISKMLLVYEFSL